MAEQTLVLTEYRPSPPIVLTTEQRDGLRSLVPGLTVEAAPGADAAYVLTSGASVGVVRVGDLTLELRPKVGLAPVLFLLSYALSPTAWRHDYATLQRSPDLVEALVGLFSRSVQEALRPGVLHGYVRRDDVLSTVRGRIRIGDQVRARTGLPLPVEVTYDDFTPDVLENRLLRTAVEALRALRLRSPDSRRHVTVLRHHLHGISPLPITRRTVPEPHWTRLNARYRPAVTLARLLISGAGLEARAGSVDGSALVLDMNAVFEGFVRAALREELRLTPSAFPSGSQVRSVHLDDGRTCRLQPDLSWWRGGRCLAVGDCKYKRIGATPNDDLHQMLAYLTALQLDTGLLVYAKGEDVDRVLTIPHANKTVRVRVVDVSRQPTEVLAQVGRVAVEFATTASSATGPHRGSGTAAATDLTNPIRWRTSDTVGAIS